MSADFAADFDAAFTLMFFIFAFAADMLHRLLLLLYF